MNQSDYWIRGPIRLDVDCTYAHRLLNGICAGHGVHYKSVTGTALVTRALATIINLGKLAALVKVSGCALNRCLGAQLPAVCNGGFSPRKQALTITYAVCFMAHHFARNNTVIYMYATPRISYVSTGLAIVSHTLVNTPKQTSASLCK